MSYTSVLKFAASSLVLLLSACGGGGGDSPATSAQSVAAVAPAANVPASQQSTGAVSASKPDQEIAALVYDGQQRTPSDFYAESTGGASKVVATTHLKNRDVLDANAPVRFEMCTDDWTEALEWSELAATRAAQRTDLVENNSNDRYFEFVRANFANADAPTVRHRVFRCSYVDRRQVDLDALSGHGGRLNQVRVQASAVRELGEYLWQFSRFNNYGNVVLSSSTSETASAVNHELRMAILVRGGVSAGCDRIDIVNWIRSADRETGVITRTFETLRQFGARETAGGVEMCAN